MLPSPLAAATAAAAAASSACAADDEAASAAPWPSAGAIEFRDVVFRYDPADAATTVLRGLTFSVAPGTKLGVIGRRGSGKTVRVRAWLRDTHGWS